MFAKDIVHVLLFFVSRWDEIYYASLESRKGEPTGASVYTNINQLGWEILINLLYIVNSSHCSVCGSLYKFLEC